MKKKYQDEQFLITTLLEKSMKNNKIVQAYMFSSEDINYIFDFAKEFAKDLICDGLEEKDKISISNRIDQNIYSELKIIEPINNIIKKDQFLSIKEYLSNKPLEGNKIVYIIKNCEKMNKKTANSMLKFIEEASDNLIAIFLTDNLDLVIPTITSRCQVLNFNNVSKLSLDKIINQDNETTKDYINNTITFVKYIENNGINTFFKSKQLIHDVFKNNEEIRIFLNLLLYFYYDCFNYIVQNKIKYFLDNEQDIIDISKKLNVNKIIEKINVIENNISNNNYNLNQKLLIDKLLIEMSDV